MRLKSGTALLGEQRLVPPDLYVVIDVHLLVDFIVGSRIDMVVVPLHPLLNGFEDISECLILHVSVVELTLEEFTLIYI